MNLKLTAFLILILLFGSSESFGQKVPPEMLKKLQARSTNSKKVEQHNPAVKGEVRSGFVFLPGMQTASDIEYEVIDGLAIFEGDIILGDANVVGQNLRSATASSTNLLWSGSTIPYEIHSLFMPKKRNQILAAIAELNAKTNLNIVPRNDEDDYVLFVPSDGCSSYVGRQSGLQPINISSWCEKGSIMHEILHAAGFYHEQSRNDRDEHVEIKEENIVFGYQHNFWKMGNDGFDPGPYDFGSIMHYPLTAFGKDRGDGKPMRTIKVKNPAIKDKFDIGQREELSFHDKHNVNLYYPTGIPYTPGDWRIVTTIRKLNALSEDECNSRMDFYASTETGAGAYWSPGNGISQHDFQVRVGKNNLDVHWTSLCYLPKTNTTGQVIIKVSDMDTKPQNLMVRPGDPNLNPDCGGMDDAVDINPDRGKSYLPLHINLQEGTVSLIRSNNSLSVLGNVGEEIISSGILSGQHTEKARITFRIDVQ
ncbi:MAG: M12 family metallopeptidase [Bacteroidota bacterium]